MNILLVASEAVPFAKTGGLADVMGALPAPLGELGHQVSLVMPFYRKVRERGVKCEKLDVQVRVPIRGKEVAGEICASTIPGTEAKVYFIVNDHYYDRPELYGEYGEGGEGDYPDNCERFVFFSRAALELMRVLDLHPDVLHLNDWQTGLVPAYLKTLYSQEERYTGIASLFTVHNLAYQGTFWGHDMALTGLDWAYFNWRQLEFYGALNLLKGGLVFADVLSTVSQRYAQEIQTEEFGCGLQGVLAERSQELFGVLNGVDYGVWNPESDRLIAANYSVKSLAGKRKCKQALQEKNHLPRQNLPLIGMISRLADQKGFDLLAEAMPELMKMDLQLVILGTGEEKYHTLLEDIARRFPHKVGINLRYDNQLAHEIEAGADMFLMPSRYEPCGLNQLYSLKYGTVPVVHATGGLADTITDLRASTLKQGTANGFSFESYSSEALVSCVRRALQTYQDRKTWRKLVKIGMSQDWSWKRSASKYVELYQKAVARKSEAAD